MTADRQTFSATRKRRHKTATIEGFGTVRIQSLTAGELHEVSTAKANEVNGRLFVKTIVDDDGLRLFADQEWTEFDALDAAIGGPIIEAITSHVGSWETDPKNSPATSGDDSPSS